MSTELTTEVKTHVVITRSDLHIYITEKQYDYIMTNSADSRIRGVPLKTQNGKETFVSWGDIASMPDLETYYDSFPDKRPDPLAMVRQVFGNVEVIEDGRSKMTMREYAEKYLADHPNEDSSTTRFLKKALNTKIGEGGKPKGKHETLYHTWQDRYYALPLELLENRTKEKILEFLKEAPPVKLEQMKDIITQHLETKHSTCDCPEVGTCRPAGLLAAIMKQLDEPVKKGK